MNISQLKRKPTSDRDILSLIETNIVRYNTLKMVRSIDDILVNNSAVILIDNKNSNIGHWVCVVKHGNTLSYFDSYGRPPDPKMYHIHTPYLSKLMHDSKYDLEYNDNNYQGANTSTCGRHVITRILLKDYPLSYYDRFMKQFDNDDDLVSALTYMAKNK